MPFAVLVSADLPERVWLFYGKLHPVVVHFPIALLIVAAGAEFLRRRRGVWSPSNTAVVCAVLGSVGAALAAAAGWSGALTAGHQESSIALHRWVGVGTVATAAIAALLAMAARRGASYRAFNWYRLFLVLAAGGVGVAGHLGGVLVYGDGYVKDAIALLKPQSKPQSEPKPEPGTVVGPAVALASDRSRAVDYVSDVRPILARRCFSCHSGSDPAGGLNLDDRAAVLKGGKSGVASVVPGSAGTSRLVALISGHDPDTIMPPKGGKLDADQIAVISAWIDQGATWAQTHAPGEHWHWAYRTPKRPQIPPVSDPDWPTNPIDSFVLAGLDAAGLKPSPEADRATLIRRASLDLIGLPPTPAEVDAFVRDDRPGAYQRVVDRLLGSPHFGERWARVWLDLARYADTHGYEKDARRSMWPYRDWVIDAFNADMPFDQFTVEQLAGDLLPDPTLSQVVATGFNRNTMINEEGGVDPEEFRVDAVVDRVNTVGSVWLGSTIACAQCHDHKFDPVSQKDYFRLYSYFNQDAGESDTFGTSGGASVSVPKREDRAGYEALWKQVRELQETLADQTEALKVRQAEWEKACLTATTDWAPVRPTKMEAASGASLTLDDEGAVVAAGEVPPEKDTYTVEFEVDRAGLTAIRLEPLPVRGVGNGAVGRAQNGNFVLTSIKVEAISPDGAPRTLPLADAIADHVQVSGDQVWAPTKAIEGVPGMGWAVSPLMRQALQAVFVLAEPTASAGRVRVTLGQEFGERHTLARFRVSYTTDTTPIEPPPMTEYVATALRVPMTDRNGHQNKSLTEFMRRVHPEIRATVLALAKAERAQNELAVGTSLVMRSHRGTRENYLHVKGSFLDKGEPVSPGVPGAFGVPAPQRGDRLGLARWLVDPRNPLTARVAVNRLWEQVFGRGIVVTVEDFGTQGDAPTHPELLDWLATEFVRGGWSTKAVLRLVVTSSAYRQSSRVTPELLEHDPYNALISRGPRHRVEAEMIRDIALSASGLLSPKIGGPSVFPPQPPGIWTMIYSNDEWKESEGEDRYRRGVYTFWRRTAPYPTFAGFDAPTREVVCTRRARTSTPLQALTTLNDPQFVEAAGALAKRLMAEGGATPESRVTLGWRLCVARDPAKDEVDRLVRLYRDQREAFERDASAAAALTGLPSDTAAETAAWHVVASVLLNLDETLTKG